MGKEYRDGDWLREQYIDNQNSIGTIADLCDCSPSTISDWMGRHGIETRDHSESLRMFRGTHEGKYNDPEWLREQYVKKERSAIDIAEECGVHHDTIYKRLETHGIERRTIKEATNKSDEMGYEGREHPAWNEYAAHYIHERDNYEVWQDNYNNKKQNVLVHRLLAVAEYGFREVVDKEVHHKNGIRWDNRPENIEVLTSAEHTKRHHEQGDYPQSAE